MHQVLDFLALLFGVRTVNNAEGYPSRSLAWVGTIRPLVKNVFLAVVGLFLLLLLVSVLSQNFFRERNTRQKMTQLRTLLEQRHQMQAHLPATLAEVISNDPMTRALTQDSWGNTIVYRQDPARQTFTLLSAGPDQKLHTSDDLSLQQLGPALK